MYGGSEMQKQLIECYEAFKASNDFDDSLSGELTAPLLLSVTERWQASKPRVLVIGQETMGWGFDPVHDWCGFKGHDDSIQTLVNGYRSFEFARNNPKNHRSPFWRAYRHFREVLGDEQDGIDTSVLWTNLFRMSISGCSVIKEGTPKEVEQLRDASRDVLHAELRILQPTAVIFFTGPNYDGNLDAVFPGLERSSFDEFDRRTVAQLTHPSLPTKAWRTYHPAYLQRSGQWRIINTISDQLLR